MFKNVLSDFVLNTFKSIKELPSNESIGERSLILAISTFLNNNKTFSFGVYILVDQ